MLLILINNCTKLYSMKVSEKNQRFPDNVKSSKLISVQQFLLGRKVHLKLANLLNLLRHLKILLSQRYSSEELENY